MKEGLQLNESAYDVNQSFDHLGQLAKTGFLVTYNMRHWYSAWIVMKRVYSLFPALKALQDDMGSGGPLTDNDEKLIYCLRNINRDVLEKVLHYLLPLVQAIVYSQQESSNPVDVIAIIHSLQDFYSSTNLILVNQTVFTECFKDRLACDLDIPSPIRTLLYDEWDMQWKEDLSETNLEVRAFVDSVHQVIKKHVFSADCGSFFTERKEQELIDMMEAVRDEILRYMTSYSERENLPLRTYFDRASWKYPILYQVYKDLFVDVVTSASVEQLFAEHGTLHIPQNNQLDEAAENTFVMLKTNYKFIENNGLQDELYDYLGEPGSRKRNEPTMGHLYPL